MKQKTYYYPIIENHFLKFNLNIVKLNYLMMSNM